MGRKNKTLNNPKHDTLVYNFIAKRTFSDSVQWFDIFTKADKNQETICCRFRESVGNNFLMGL